MKSKRTKICGCSSPAPMKTGQRKTPQMYCRVCDGWLAGEWYDTLLGSMKHMEERTQRREFERLPDERIYTPLEGMLGGKTTQREGREEQGGASGGPRSTDG